MSSRLFIEVRERRGLAYYIKTGVEAYEDTGYLATQAGVDHKNAVTAIETILNEYKKISTGGVSEKELRKAKDFLRGKAVMGMESSDEVAIFHVEQETSRGKILTIEEIFFLIEKVTVEDIKNIAKDIFQNKKLNLAVIGPHKNAKIFERVLNLG